MHLKILILVARNVVFSISQLDGQFKIISWLMQSWECTSGKEMAWNILSLFTTTGMLFLEVSLLAFLLQGNYASGLEALTRTFVVSGLIVGLDLFLKVFSLFLNFIPPWKQQYLLLTMSIHSSVGAQRTWHFLPYCTLVLIIQQQSLHSLWAIFRL